MKKISILGIALATLIGTCSASQGQRDNHLHTTNASWQEQPPMYQEGSLYVRFSDKKVVHTKGMHLGSCPTEFILQKTSIRQFGIHPSSTLILNSAQTGSQTFRIRFDSINKTEELIRQLQERPDIELVEKVPVHYINPPQLPQNGTKSKIKAESDNIPTTWHLDMVGGPVLWQDGLKGNESVRVAVVDNAVWAQHEDLQLDEENLYDATTGQAHVSNPPQTVEQDEQGTMEAPSSAYGWSHGTHCAGLIAAVNDNGLGISSIGGGITLMGVKASSYDSRAIPYTMEGVTWAVENGAKIVSMSFGSTASSETEKLFFEEYSKKGVIFIAAAGNSGISKRHYPASYPGVISVGSINSDGSRSYFSNYGDWVKIWAPGGFYVENGNIIPQFQIFSTTYCISQYFPETEGFSGKYYDMMAGTSMATPLVSSCVALLLSHYPELNAYQVLELLQNCSTSKGIYLPTAFSQLEETDKKISHLQAWKNEETGKIQVKWEAPEKQDVTSYALYRNGELLAETPNKFYSFKDDDTTGYVGVQALYGEEKSLTEYIRIQKEEPGVKNKQTRSASINHYVDPLNKTVYLLSEQPLDLIEVFDMRGVRLLQTRNTDRFQANHLPSGIYIGRAYSDNGMYFFKFSL